MSDALPKTEERNPRTEGLDVLDTPSLVALLLDEQCEAARAALAQAHAIASAADEIAKRLLAGGRLHYVGAGTSGRLGVLDAAEMPPTFGTPLDLVCAHIAGGDAALRRAIEGAEDDAEAGEAQMRDHVRSRDAVVGVSASGGAPFVVRAVAYARACGAYTVAIANTAPSPLASAAEASIVLDTGAEPLTGSTRLKAGTSQKIALNAISTTVMVRLGKVYDNLMVDVVATNAKLRRRALRLVRTLTGLEETQAQAQLDAAGGSVKIAVVMARRGLDPESAKEALRREGGMLRPLM
jgi:N-acetylmuramic acid 6-phosphate etherase